MIGIYDQNMYSTLTIYNKITGVFRQDPQFKLNEEKLHKVTEKKFDTWYLTSGRPCQVTCAPLWSRNFEISISKGIRSVLISC